MNRLTFDPTAVINSIDSLNTVLIAVFGALGVWVVGVVVILLIIRGGK